MKKELNELIECKALFPFIVKMNRKIKIEKQDI